MMEKQERLFLSIRGDTMEQPMIERLEQTRKELIRLGVKLGFEHPFVQEWSRLLDRLHNQWNEQQKQQRSVESARPLKDQLMEYPIRIEENRMAYA
jgi:hypothetical protein